MSSASAVVLGAVISGLVGVLVVFFQQKLVGRHEVDAARPVRLCDFSGAGWTATLLFSELALTFTHPHTGWTRAWSLSRGSNASHYLIQVPGTQNAISFQCRRRVPARSSSGPEISGCLRAQPVASALPGTPLR